MTSDSESMPSDLARSLWRASGFLWLQVNKQFSDFDIDSCLDRIEADPAGRDSALAAFWGTYFASHTPPTLNNQQVKRISKLLEPGSQQGAKAEDVKNLAFVRLHLAGSLAVCLIRPDWPMVEYPSVTWILEKIREASALAEPPEIDVGDPRASGRRLLEEDLFGFSIRLISGICLVELSLRRADEGKYEEALYLISLGAWDICATTTEAGPTWGIEGTPGLQPDLPHSGTGFNIQEAVNIFEGLKEHSKDVKDWENVRLCCDVLRYLQTEDLYDWLDTVKDAHGEEFGAAEYWVGAMSFCESQMRMISPDHYVLTRDVIERAETKERLKRDFLPDYLWDAMGSEAQKALVDAELHWIHGRSDDMVRDIRPLLELVLPSVFFFLQPVVGQKRDPRLILTRIRDALRDNQIVRASVDSLRIDLNEKAWVKDKLHIFLHKVIDTRNYFEKEQHQPGRDRDKQKYLNEAAVIRNELLGIGCSGVLPRLMRIKQVCH